MREPSDTGPTTWGVRIEFALLLIGTLGGAAALLWQALR